MRSRYIILGCVVAIALAGFAAIGRMGFHRPPPFPVRLHMPPQLRSASVITGRGLLLKRTFLEKGGLGRVTDIVAGRLDRSPGTQIGIAGTSGAVILDKAGREVSSAAFPPGIRRIGIVDVEDDGVCEYMNRGSCTYHASLIDHKGKTIWTYKRPDAIDDMAAGDIDGDGLLEFVVGFNGDGGVHLLGSDGKVIWKQKDDGDVWHVEMTDTNGDGHKEILHSNVAGMVVRDGRGRILRQMDPEPMVTDFSLTRWPDRSSREYILTSDPDEVTFLGTPILERDSIWLLKLDGTTMKRLDAPLSSVVGDAQGLPIRLSAGQPDYFAVLVSLAHWERAVLYIYDPAGALIYEEVLSEPCGSIAAVALPHSKAEALLVGGMNRVWQYRMR